MKSVQFKISKMKSPLFLIAMVFANTFDSFCQIPGYREDTSIPTFDLEFLILKSSNNLGKEFKFLDTSISDFLKEFPDPDKNEDFYFEIGEVMARLIAYEESELYFLEGKLSDFRFQDSNFSIGNGESFIKVGDHYSLVEKLFPSYRNEIDLLEEENSRRIYFPLSNGEIELDDALVIIFELETGQITEIVI